MIFAILNETILVKIPEICDFPPFKSIFIVQSTIYLLNKCNFTELYLKGGNLSIKSSKKCLKGAPKGDFWPKMAYFGHPL